MLMIKCLMFKIGLSMVNYVDCQVLYKEKQFCSDFRYAIGFLDKTGVMKSVLLWRERMNWKTKSIVMHTLWDKLDKTYRRVGGRTGVRMTSKSCGCYWWWQVAICCTGCAMHEGLGSHRGPRQSQGPPQSLGPLTANGRIYLLLS